MRRTTIVLVVLSEDPIPERMDVADVAREWDTGEYVLYSTSMSSEAVSKETMAGLLTEAGSDPAFFQLDDVVSS